MNSNQRLTSRTSPWRDPVLWAIWAGCAVAVAIVLALTVAFLHTSQAHCPPQDHPVWAQVLDHGHGEWICGASLTIGVKSR